MVGKTKLSELLSEMDPILNPGSFVFVSVPNGTKINLAEIVGSFAESEGTTLIVPKTYADGNDFNYTFEAAWITLQVHSSLQAVGLTAAVAKVLAEHDISCNVVAAYHHDHIFVGKQDAERALELLKGLT